MDRNKKIILILDVLLFVGLLVYSVIFLIINKSLNPATIAGNDIHIRLMWRQAAETIFTVCSFVYVIGHILIIYSFASRRISASLRTIFLYFTTQVGLMFLCTVPFAVFDLSFFGDYVFPIWSTVGILLILLFVTLTVGFYQKRKEA